MCSINKTILYPLQLFNYCLCSLQWIGKASISVKTRLPMFTIVISLQLNWSLLPFAFIFIFLKLLSFKTLYEEASNVKSSCPCPNKPIKSSSFSLALNLTSDNERMPFHLFNKTSIGFYPSCQIIWYITVLSLSSSGSGFIPFLWSQFILFSDKKKCNNLWLRAIVS